MSWFYDALKRAEEEQVHGLPANGATVSSEQGALFLAALEAVSSISRKPIPASAPVVPVVTDRMAVTEVTEIPAPLTSLPSAVPHKSVRPPERVSSVDNFPRVTLPLHEASRLVFLTDRHGLAAEQYRLLRGRLTQEFFAGGVLLLTSPGKGDGKTLTALNLCSCLADAGDSTILVELDLRQPAVVNTLGCKISSPGIEDVMAGKAEARQAVHFMVELGLHVAVVCEAPKDPSQLVTGKHTQQFLEWAKENFRWVILDSPPVVPAADVSELLPLVNGVVLVVRAEHTPKDLVKRAFEMIGPRLHNVIFNEATVDSNPYYRYMSQYYSGPAAPRKK